MKIIEVMSPEWHGKNTTTDNAASDTAKKIASEYIRFVHLGECREDQISRCSAAGYLIADNENKD